MNELNRKDRQLLTALHGVDEPTDADAVRVKQRVLQTVAGAATTAAATASTQAALAASGASLASKAGATALGVKLTGLFVGGAAVLGGGYVAVRAVDSDQSSTPAVESRPPQQPQAHTAHAPQAVLKPAEAEERDETNESPEPPPVPSPTIESPAPPKSSSSDDGKSAAKNLEAELRLLRQAQQALRSGRPSAALAQLEAHQRRFPKGVLASERRATYAIALCQSGKLERGRSMARSFLAARKQSPMAGRMRSACGLEPH